MPLPQSMRRFAGRKKLLLGVAAAIIIVVIFLSTRTPPVETRLVEVSRGTVEAAVSNTRAGTVKACRRAKMSPSAGGQIAQLLVKKGQRVAKNQVLLRLWSKDLQAQDQLAREQLGTAQAQIKQACEQADLADKEAVRARELRKQGFISQQGVDQRDSAARVAHAGCESARTQASQAQSRIQVARAAVERMTLRAPFSGIVADISGEQGEFATPSPPGIPTPPAIDLIDDSCMYVSAPIDEVDAAHVKVGQTARITLDAVKGRVFAGRVRRIAPYVLEIEKQARTVEVEVEFTDLQPGGAASAVNGDEAVNLLIGYSADVEIVYDQHAGVLRVPTNALLEGKKVLVYGANDRLEERNVKTGLSSWEQTEIIDGLKEGDRIVLSLDKPGVKPGAKARPEAPSQDK